MDSSSVIGGGCHRWRKWWSKKMVAEVGEGRGYGRRLYF